MAKTIANQEIFAAGKWSGDQYTINDLDEIVRSFHALKFNVPLKLGHDEAQKWFGQKDGAPALGWVDNLRRVANKLVADFVNVPDALAKMIANKNYRSKSAEVYWNLENDGQKWPRALKAVSLLGADMPAVTTLNELQTVLMSDTSQYSITTWADPDGAEEPEWKSYTWTNQQEDTMSAEQEKIYKDQISALQDTIKAETKRADEAEARAVSADAELKKRDEKYAIDQFISKVDSLIKEGKVAPSEKDTLERQFVALGAGTKKYGEKEFNPRQELVQSLEARTVKIHIGKEQGKGGEEKDDGEAPAVVKVDRLAKKYAADNKGTYQDGLRKVKEEDRELWNEYLAEAGGRK